MSDIRLEPVPGGDPELKLALSASGLPTEDLLVIALHLGSRWTVVMATFRGMLGVQERSLSRALLARAGALAIAAWGMKSSFEMAFGSKLMLTYTLDM
ncbi:hypothetical protein [Sinorhizobium sp. BG8]|uniref:hypothetical protein n=1 Tax=Sinorhizobium sp. BG8 TaxID=2613773 RepID=UPI00193DBB61|nr:hypothetical protein [Sinorhizobium sp. BG8]QRM55106.1 hypothetical protein F3Y30_11585 [Sinorhizobium sp. BG8]